MLPALAIAAALLTGFGPAAASDKLTAIQCGALVDVEQELVRDNVTILVRNDVIEAVGQDIVIPAGTAVIDLKDRHCLPGVMDMHTHLQQDLSRPLLHHFFIGSSADKALSSMKKAQGMLHNGFTTLRIVGDMDVHFSDISVRNAINRGEYIGPRLVVAPHVWGSTGGHADIHEIAPDHPSGLTGSVVDGADEIRRAVRRDIKYGADWIKITASGGVMSEVDGPKDQQFTQEELNTFVSEAARYDVKVAAHVHGGPAADAVIEAGVGSLEHGLMLDKPQIRKLAKSDTWLVVTAYVLDYLKHQIESGNASISASNQAKVYATLKTRNEAYLYAHEMGVKIALGTDPFFPIDQQAREFSALVMIGIPPMEVLKYATINAATLLGMETQIGSIEAGKQADIIAVPDNPITDISTMERVNFVMLAGEVIR